MGIGAISGAAPRLSPSVYDAPSASPKADGSDKRPAEELTTVTTQCTKTHWHDQSCPHTVSTTPAPKSGASGTYLDVLV